MKIAIRPAKIEDIDQMLVVRNSVTENMLSNPKSVTEEDCIAYITQRGKGWVCEVNDVVIGFSIVDLQDNEIWALFILPEFEKQGIGRQLHDTLLDWYFAQTTQHIELSTSPKTRAYSFYHKAGWSEIGILMNGEIKFELTFDNWKKYGN